MPDPGDHVPHPENPTSADSLSAALAELEAQILSDQPTVFFNRMPLIAADGLVWGYCLTMVDPTKGRAEDEKHIEAALHELDLDKLAYTRPLLIPATMNMLDGSISLPQHDGVLGLVLQPHLVNVPGVADHLRRLRNEGVLTVIGDYRGGERQDELLPFTSHVQIGFGDDVLDHSELAARAIAAGSKVIAEGVPGGLQNASWPTGVQLVMDAVYGAQQSTDRQLSPNELACLEAVRLLSVDDVESSKIATVLGTDPEMVMRLLHLVNASTEGLPNRVDSLNQAIVLLGPAKITGLVMASLISSSVKNIDNLWLLIARGAACRELAGGDDAAYTVGLLSALAHETGIPPRTLAERTRVSREASAALILHEGPLGRILQAVIAHEHHDSEGVARAGLSAEAVALAYLEAIPWALSTVLATSGTNS